METSKKLIHEAIKDTEFYNWLWEQRNKGVIAFAPMQIIDLHAAFKAGQESIVHRPSEKSQ